MKSSLSLLLAASAHASPLIPSRQSTCPNTFISPPRAAEIRSAFLTSHIIPDAVSDFTPTTELTVKYGNINENLGNEFTVLQTLQEPLFSFPPEEGHDPATTKYTYIQVVPDAPDPALPLLRQFLHHIVYDLQPSCITAQSPKTQAPYMLLTPLSVAPHRYMSLLYRQRENYKPPALNLVEDVVRAPFDLASYVQEAGLVLVGGNYMIEGLGGTVCALVPGCTNDGRGYEGKMDGSALTGMGELIKGLVGGKE